MNEAGPKIKQQIIDKIKNSTNILVTVSKDPTVDELTAAIGLTTILNKIGKHGTAIFSGDIPPAINFLDPDKVFENTADSLRDFIIALDKEKADHLRYKVEGDVVKIFITPYRTTITSDDLDFSQGDYNIELVLALGVANQEHLDTALSAHGQVLHDVAIATFSAGKQSSQLGSMDWRDSGASSLSEMVANFSELLKTDKSILDKQISTALLTGIVAATDRFSNLLTTSRVMTTAALLMGAGADQQLIAARLQESHEIDKLDKIPVVQKIDKPDLTEQPIFIEEQVLSSTLPTGSLVIEHPIIAEVEKKPDIIAESSVDTLPKELLNNAPTTQLPPQPKLNNSPASTLPPPVAVAIPERQVYNVVPPVTAEPILGGALSATIDQAAEDKQRQEKNDQNKTILTHSYLSDSDPGSTNPINGIGQTEPEPVDIFADGPFQSPNTETFQSNNIATPQPRFDNPPIGIPADVQTAMQPPIPNLPLPPQLPDFSTLPTMGPATTGFSAPVASLQPNFGNSNVAPQNPTSNDPGQFMIPGQQ